MLLLHACVVFFFIDVSGLSRKEVLLYSYSHRGVGGGEGALSPWVYLDDL